MKKILKWGGLALVVLIIIGAISGGSSNNSGAPRSGSENQATKQETKTYAVNEPISTGKLDITLTSIEERTQVGGQYLNEKASEGATLIAIGWKYKNVSDKPVGSFSQPSVKLVDSNGTEYDWDLGKSSTYATEKKLDSKVLSDLNPGITVNEAKVFEIGKESYAKSGWKVKFQVDGNSYLVGIN